MSIKLALKPGSKVWYCETQLEYSECHCTGCRYRMVLTGRAFYRVYTGKIERVELVLNGSGKMVATYHDKFNGVRTMRENMKEDYKLSYYRTENGARQAALIELKGIGEGLMLEGDLECLLKIIEVEEMPESKPITRAKRQR